MIIKNLNYSKYVAIAIFLSILNLGSSSSTAAVDASSKQDKSQVNLSTLQQPNSSLPSIEQTIPLPSQSIIASSFGGRASWYGPGFHGRLTANGERYNQYAFTAAHRYLRFGTRVRVTNLNNGRSVVVRINDRGPFVRGRVIDLSAAAASSINMIHSGVAPVRVTVLGR